MEHVVTAAGGHRVLEVPGEPRAVRGSGVERGQPFGSRHDLRPPVVPAGQPLALQPLLQVTVGLLADAAVACAERRRCGAGVEPATGDLAPLVAVGAEEAAGFVAHLLFRLQLVVF